MNCPRCSEAVEAGAMYCGNCGQRLPVNDKVQASPAADPAIPSYALADPVKQKAESRTTLGLILSVLSVPGAIIPFLGAGLAVAGLVIATSSRAALAKKSMGNVAVVFAGLGIVLSAGAYIYNLNEYNKQQAKSEAASKSAILASSSDQSEDMGVVIDTPCYRTTAPAVSGAHNPAGSCSAQAFNASTLAVSTNAYNLQAVIQKDLNTGNLASTGRTVADSYLASNLPGFAVTGQETGTFAGSPSYFISANNGRDVTVEMAIVLRQAAHGENVFVLVHAANGQASLAPIEKAWQWK